MKSHLEGSSVVRFTGNTYPLYKINKQGVVVHFMKPNWGTLVHEPNNHRKPFLWRRWQESNFEPLKGKVVLSN